MLKKAGSLYLLLKKVARRLLMICLRKQFKLTGRQVVFDPFGTYSFSTIEIGDNVFIGDGARLHASESGIRIGNFVMIGPDVTMMGGDHNTSEIGKQMCLVNIKKPQHDRRITIEDDVWIGANVTILKGVTIGRGSIIGAGSVVTRDTKPYSLNLGVPAKYIRARWSDDEIIEHERNLYPAYLQTFKQKEK